MDNGVDFVPVSFCKIEGSFNKNEIESRIVPKNSALLLSSNYYVSIKLNIRRKMRILNSLIVPKIVCERGDPLGFFNIHSVAKYQKNEGGPFEDIKNFSKTKVGIMNSLIVSKKWKEGTVLLWKSFAFHVRGCGCVQNQVLSNCGKRTVHKKWTVVVDRVELTKKTSHCKSRAFSSKTPTKNDCRFLFFQFPFVATSSHIFEHAEMRSETRGVQGFGAKSGSGPSAQQLKNTLKALVVFFPTRYKSFVGLNKLYIAV